MKGDREMGQEVKQEAGDEEEKEGHADRRIKGGRRNGIVDEKWGGKRGMEKGKNGLFMSVTMRKGGEADHLVLASVDGLLLHLLCSGMNARDGFWFEALYVV